MTELSPVLTASDVPRRYDDAGLNGGSPRRQSSLDVLAQNRITLTWTNLNVHVPVTRNGWCPRCPELRGDVTQLKQILYNGLSQIINKIITKNLLSEGSN